MAWRKPTKRQSQRASARRRNRIKKNGGSHTKKEWDDLVIKFDNKCAYCGISGEETPLGHLTKDHIIEICMGGPDSIDNIMPLCNRCNIMKEMKRRNARRRRRSKKK